MTLSENKDDMKALGFRELSEGLDIWFYQGKGLTPLAASVCKVLNGGAAAMIACEASISRGPCHRLITYRKEAKTYQQAGAQTRDDAGICLRK